MSQFENRMRRAGADLRAATLGMPRPSPRSQGRWQALASFVGGAVVVALAIGVPVMVWGGSGGGQSPLAGEPTTSTTSTTVAPETTEPVSEVSTTSNPEDSADAVASCGAELPFTALLPDDFTGPSAGPSPEAEDPVAEGQLVVHWTGRGGSVELRWPADVDYIEDAEWGTFVPPTPGDQMDNVGFVLNEPGSEPPYFEAYASFPTDVMEGPCDATQVSLYGAGGGSFTYGHPKPGEEGALAIIPDLPRDGFGALVVDSIDVESVPEVVACSGASEFDDVPATKSSAVVNGETFATAVEALEALLTTADAEYWPKTGYFELIESDGSITYGNPFVDDPLVEPTPSSGLVTSISMTEVEGGWTVDSWTTSGC